MNRIQHAESSLSHGFVLLWIMFKNLIMEQKDLSFPDGLLEFGLVKDVVNISSNLNNLISEPSVSGVVFSVFFIPYSMC